jgi:hypothetical protein
MDFQNVFALVSVSYSWINLYKISAEGASMFGWYEKRLVMEQCLENYFSCMILKIQNAEKW